MRHPNLTFVLDPDLVHRLAQQLAKLLVGRRITLAVRTVDQLYEHRNDGQTVRLRFGLQVVLVENVIEKIELQFAWKPDAIQCVLTASIVFPAKM